MLIIFTYDRFCKTFILALMIYLFIFISKCFAGIRLDFEYEYYNIEFIKPHFTFLDKRIAIFPFDSPSFPHLAEDISLILSSEILLNKQNKTYSLGVLTYTNKSVNLSDYNSISYTDKINKITEKEELDFSVFGRVRVNKETIDDTSIIVETFLQISSRSIKKNLLWKYQLPKSMGNEFLTHRVNLGVKNMFLLQKLKLNTSQINEISNISKQLRNVHKDNDISSDIISKIPFGTTYSVLNHYNGWAKIKFLYNKKTIVGWVIIPKFIAPKKFQLLNVSNYLNSIIHEIYNKSNSWSNKKSISDNEETCKNESKCNINKHAEAILDQAKALNKIYFFDKFFDSWSYDDNCLIEKWISPLDNNNFEIRKEQKSTFVPTLMKSSFYNIRTIRSISTLLKGIFRSKVENNNNQIINHLRKSFNNFNKILYDKIKIVKHKLLNQQNPSIHKKNKENRAFTYNKKYLNSFVIFYLNKKIKNLFEMDSISEVVRNVTMSADSESLLLSKYFDNISFIIWNETNQFYYSGELYSDDYDKVVFTEKDLTEKKNNFLISEVDNYFDKEIYVASKSHMKQIAYYITKKIQSIENDRSKLYNSIQLDKEEVRTIAYDLSQHYLNDPKNIDILNNLYVLYKYIGDNKKSDLFLKKIKSL